MTSKQTLQYLDEFIGDGRSFNALGVGGLLASARSGISMKFLVGAFLASRHLANKRARVILDSEDVRAYFQENPKVVHRQRTIRTLRDKFSMKIDMSRKVVSEYIKLTKNGRRPLPKSLG